MNDVHIHSGVYDRLWVCLLAIRIHKFVLFSNSSSCYIYLRETSYFHSRYVHTLITDKDDGDGGV